MQKRVKRNELLTNGTWMLLNVLWISKVEFIINGKEMNTYNLFQ